MLTVADCSSREFGSISIDLPRLSDLDAAVAQFAGQPFVLRSALPGGQHTCILVCTKHYERSSLTGGTTSSVDGPCSKRWPLGRRPSRIWRRQSPLPKSRRAIDVSIVIGVDASRSAVCVLVPSWLSAVLPSVGVVQDAGIAPSRRIRRQWRP